MSTHDPEAFRVEAERCRTLLIEYCVEFLEGNIPAFRRRYRELFLYSSVANARDTALASRDATEAAEYERWLKDYKKPLPG
jgi:hypothetical protein